MKFSILIIATFWCSLVLSQAQTFTYDWNSTTDTLDGNNNAGTWNEVSFSHNVNTGVLNVLVKNSVSSDSSEHTDSLWMTITNGPTPYSSNSDYAAVYLHGGNYYVTPYGDDPSQSHQLGTMISTGSYSVTTIGSQKVFSLTLDADAINAWTGGGPTWKGIGFPYDAQGNTAGNAYDPYRIGAWIRSYEADGVSLSGLNWNVNYGQYPDENVGMWDIGNAVVNVPEPSSTALLGLGGLALLLRRKRAQ